MSWFSQPNRLVSVNVFATDSGCTLFLQSTKVRYRVLGTRKWYHSLYRLGELFCSWSTYARLRQVSHIAGSLASFGEMLMPASYAVTHQMLVVSVLLLLESAVLMLCKRMSSESIWT